MSGSGLSAHPDGTLVDRAIRVLAASPADSGRLTREVLGIPKSSGAVAERLVAALLGSDPRVGRLSDGRWTMVAIPGASPGVDLPQSVSTTTASTCVVGPMETR